MNLSQMIEYAGARLDYDPVNPTYREQLAAFLNDAQRSILGDREWDFAQISAAVGVQTDQDYEAACTAGSASVVLLAGYSFDYSTSTILPGSTAELGELIVTDSTGLEGRYQIRFVASTTTAYLDRPFEGTTGNYAISVRYRATYLPPSTSTILGVQNPVLGIPASMGFLAKMTREEVGVNPDLLGTAGSWTPWEPLLVPPPRQPYGVSAVTVGAGRGVRTINVYQVNVYAPSYWGWTTYPGFSGGFESGLSAPQTITLSDTQDITLNPAAVSGSTGWYRRFYFTCPDEGVYAPRRLRHVAGTPPPVTGMDTIPPTDGSSILTPNTSVSVLRSAAIEELPRYSGNMSGSFGSFLLYPHPNADQRMILRWLRLPELLEDDTDTAMIPAAYARLIPLVALSSALAAKLAQPALAQSYATDAALLQRRMEAQYLAQPQRRLVKAAPAQAFWGAPVGPVRYTP